MSKLTFKKGFSLVEVMVYLAVLVTVSSACVYALVTYSTILAEQKVKRTLTNNAQLALERITREVKNADGVDLVGSTLADPTGTLELLNTGADVTFSYNGGSIDVAVAGGPAENLVGSDVNVDSLYFYHYDNGVTELVRTKITLSATSSKSSATETFYGAAVLRGSYD